MKFALRSIATATVLTFALSAAPSLFAMPTAAPQDRDDHPVRQYDYAHDHYYTMGNREGYRDYRRHVNHRRHHHYYRSDNDRHYHDFGYQQGLLGHRGYRTEYGTYHPD